MPASSPPGLQGPARPTGWRWSPTSRWIRRATARSTTDHVGVTAGPVVVRGDDYFGRTVNLAARIAAHAHAAPDHPRACDPKHEGGPRRGRNASKGAAEVMGSPSETLCVHRRSRVVGPEVRARIAASRIAKVSTSSRDAGDASSPPGPDERERGLAIGWVTIVPVKPVSCTPNPHLRLSPWRGSHPT